MTLVSGVASKNMLMEPSECRTSTPNNVQFPGKSPFSILDLDVKTSVIFLDYISPIADIYYIIYRHQIRYMLSFFWWV